MAFLVFALSLFLLGVGVAGGYMSLDLLPTGIGVLYAIGGAVAVCMAVVTFALGVMIRRIDALAELVRRQAGGPHGVANPRRSNSHSRLPPPASSLRRRKPNRRIRGGGSAEDSAAASVNENGSGHLPTLGEIEHAIVMPEAPPSLIGRYSSGGANYMIFADGSIEAETQEGTFRFASMGDFKQYLSDRKNGRR